MQVNETHRLSSKINTETEEERKQKGYSTYEYGWCWDNIPPAVVAFCIACSNKHKIKPEELLSKSLPEACSFCQRKALKIYDKKRWEYYFQYRLYNTRFFHDQFKRPFCLLTDVANPHALKKVVNVKTAEFRSFLKANPENNIAGFADVIEYCSNIAGTSEKIPLELRVAKKDNAYWWDLNNGKWQAVKITNDGWALEEPPIVFFRQDHMQEIKVEKGKKEDYKKFLSTLNLAEESDKILYTAYLATSLISDIEHPLFIAWGVQGSAKSTLTTATAKFIDPSEIPFVSLSKDQNQVVQNLFQHYMPVFDNVSSINQEQSDMFCRACTGEAFSKRKLYTDMESVHFSYRRNVIINGITSPADSPDFVDRTIFIQCGQIDDAQRKPKKEIQKKQEEYLPKARGYILDLVVHALNNKHEVETNSRLMDFEAFGTAVCIKHGWEEKVVKEAFRSQSDERQTQTLTSDPFAEIISDYFEKNRRFEGSPTELLTELKNFVEDPETKKLMPKSSVHLSRKLYKVKPVLTQRGYAISHDRKSKSSKWDIHPANEGREQKKTQAKEQEGQNTLGGQSND